MNKNTLKYFFAGVMLLSIISCKKNNLVVDNDVVSAPEAARFVMTPTSANNYYSYSILDVPTPAFIVPIGVTTVSDVDRKVKLTYTSKAVNGVQYNAPTELVIPAGKALENLIIQGIFAGYPTGRKDTLKIKITSGDGFIKKQDFQDSVMIVMQKLCPVVVASLLGDYDNTRETLGATPYGPYTTTIASYTTLSPTTASIVVENIFDFGWNPITFKLDWTDAANPKITLVQQSGIADGGTIDGDFDGEDVSVRAFTGQTGTFSMCDQTLTLKMQLGITGLGWFGDLYTVNMAR